MNPGNAFQRKRIIALRSYYSPNSSNILLWPALINNRCYFNIVYTRLSIIFKSTVQQHTSKSCALKITERSWRGDCEIGEGSASSSKRSDSTNFRDDEGKRGAGFFFFFSFLFSPVFFHLSRCEMSEDMTSCTG